MEEHYARAYESVAEFAQVVTEETTEIPEAIQYYIDYERVARDLEINDLITFETAAPRCNLLAALSCMSPAGLDGPILANYHDREVSEMFFWGNVTRVDNLRRRVGFRSVYE